MATARESHTATLLMDGRVLVAGGANSATLDTYEIYNPVMNQWSAPQTLPDTVHYHTATRLPDGRVLLAGGISGSIPTDRASVFNGTSWSSVGRMRTSRWGHQAVAMNDGGVIVVGGMTTANGAHTNFVDFFIASDGGFESRPNDSFPRAFLGIASLSTGEVLAFGGADTSDRVYSTRYSPLSNQWQNTGSLNSPRSALAWARISDQILACGGFNNAGQTLTASCEVFNPVANGWDAGVQSMSTARRHHTMTELTNGQVLLTGGATSLSDATSSCELFNPSTGQWTPARPLAVSRFQHTATRLLDGRVLVVGGKTVPTAAGTVLNSVEIYTP